MPSEHRFKPTKKSFQRLPNSINLDLQVDHNVWQARHETHHLKLELFLLQTMQDLGLTVLRTWAFNDAADNTTWMALQTEPGVFNETVFRSTFLSAAQILFPVHCFERSMTSRGCSKITSSLASKRSLAAGPYLPLVRAECKDAKEINIIAVLQGGIGLARQ